MNHSLPDRAPAAVGSAVRWLLARTGRFLWRSPFAPITVGAITTLALWRRSFWDALIALLGGILAGLILDLIRSMFGVQTAPSPRPAASPPGSPAGAPTGANPQPASASSTPAASAPATAPAATQSAFVPEPWPLPSDGLSWTNMQQLAGIVCRTPNFKTLGGGGARLAIQIATRQYVDDPQSYEPRQTVEWHWVVLWDGLAKRYHARLEKGVEVIVMGTSRSRTWKDQEGIERLATELHAKMLWIAEPVQEPEDKDDADEERKPSLRPPAKPLFDRPKLGSERPKKHAGGRAQEASARDASKSRNRQ